MKYIKLFKKDHLHIKTYLKKNKFEIPIIYFILTYTAHLCNKYNFSIYIIEMCISVIKLSKKKI